MSDPLTIQIEVQADEAIKTLTRLADGIRDPRLMERIGAEVVTFSQERILSGKNTAPDGSRWEPLAMSTILRKRKKGFGGQGTLVQRGHLWSTIVAANATADGVDIGSTCVYAMIHQKGGKTGRGHKTTIPARPYIGVSQDEELVLQRWIGRWVKDLLEEG